MKRAQRLAPKRYKKAKIHTALREQVWLRYAGPNFQTTCATRWCQNDINVFNFQCGHLQAESLGGATTLENLTPLCARCNLSMGTMHMDAWNAKSSGSGNQPTTCQTTTCKSFWSRVKNFFRREK
jgi:5-methylcytosine-specific restriction endonuclease McrA